MHYRIPKPPHGSQEWLTARWRDADGNPVVTASMAACVHNENKWTSPADYALELMADAPPEPKEATAVMERGNKMEPILLQIASEDWGVQISSPIEMYGYKTDTVSLLATLDGILEDGQPVEVKTTRNRWTGDLPPTWYWQGVQQAICAEADSVQWVIFDSDLTIHYHTQAVSSDEKWLHISACEKFFAEIAAGRVPFADTVTLDAVSRSHPESDGATVELEESMSGLIEQLREAREGKKHFTEMEESIKAKLGMALGDAEVGTINGDKVVTWKSQSRTSFDAKTFQQEHPALFDKFQRKSSYRVMKVYGA